MEDVDNIKENQTMPVYGMNAPSLFWMCGLVLLTESALPVERIRKTYPQLYPQGTAVFRSIHILENLFLAVHIWGYPFWRIWRALPTSPHEGVLIHS